MKQKTLKGSFSLFGKGLHTGLNLTVTFNPAPENHGYKIQRIEDLEKQVEHLQSALDKEKLKSHEKLEKERERFNKSIEFLKEQVAYKDKRMDLLLDAVSEKDRLHKEMLEKLLRCSKCDKYEN